MNIIVDMDRAVRAITMSMSPDLMRNWKITQLVLFILGTITQVRQNQDDDEEEDDDDDEEHDDDDVDAKEQDEEVETSKGLTGRDMVEESLYAFQRYHKLATPFTHFVEAMRRCNNNMSLCVEIFTTLNFIIGLQTDIMKRVSLRNHLLRSDFVEVCQDILSRAAHEIQDDQVSAAAKLDDDVRGNTISQTGALDTSKQAFVKEFGKQLNIFKAVWQNDREEYVYLTLESNISVSLTNTTKQIRPRQRGYV
jgi:hypothetical protein